MAMGILSSPVLLWSYHAMDPIPATSQAEHQSLVISHGLVDLPPRRPTLQIQRHLARVGLAMCRHPHQGILPHRPPSHGLVGLALRRPTLQTQRHLARVGLVICRHPHQGIPPRRPPSLGLEDLALHRHTPLIIPRALAMELPPSGREELDGAMNLK